MAQAEVHRVVGAEGRPQRADFRPARPVLHERHDLLRHVAVVLIVTGDALPRMAILGVKALRIDGIDAGYLEASGIQMIPDRADQAEVLVLVEASLRRREPDHRPAGVAEPQELHLAAEDRRVPGVVFTVHGASFRKSRASSTAAES